MSAPGPIRAAKDTRGDWSTPLHIFAQINEGFGFNLDAAADSNNTLCGAYLSGPCAKPYACHCGLCGSWHDAVVWVNPPYGGGEEVCTIGLCKKKKCVERGRHCTVRAPGLKDWIRKCASEAQKGATVVALVPDAVGPAWYSQAWETAWEKREVEGRIQFDGTTSSNPCDSVILVWRPGHRPYSAPVVSRARFAPLVRA